MEKYIKKRKKVYSECLLRLDALCVSCCSKCLFLYGQFCHGALKHDLSSTLFSNFSKYILMRKQNFMCKYSYIHKNCKNTAL